MIRFILSLCFLLCLGITPKAMASADSKSYDLKYFSEVPILHEGRVKPLESYASFIFKKLSHNKINNINVASLLLAQTLFTPEQAVSLQIFFVKDPYKYGLIERENSLYSYAEILTVIENNQEALIALSNKSKLNPNEKDFINLAKHQMIYAELLRSLTAIIPINIGEDKAVSFIDLKTDQDRENLIDVIKNAQGDLSKLDKEQQINIVSSFAFDTIKAGGRNNVSLKVINALEGTEWFSPWEIISRDNENRYNDILLDWQNLAISYRNGQTDDFLKTSKIISKQTSISRLRFEKYFNHFEFLNLSFIAFTACFIALALSSYKKLIIPKWLPAFLFIGATIFLTTQILGRVFIMQRPPVGTLYESIIFVSWIVAVNGLIVAWIQKKPLWLGMASLCSVLLLSISYFFAKEDDMQPLVAVLNSNFWLMTHVLIITAGYGLCLIASVYAHFLLWSKPARNLKGHPLLPLSIVSLLFITVGTILGGLWADQSWGRFWGWDPKENGALLILLWISWLLHARLTPHCTDRIFTAGVALLSIIVALAWFGVNLLNVGLHSYGFTQGIFWGLVVFCAAEITIVTSLYYRNKNETPA